MQRKKLFRWIKIVLMLYGVIGIAIYYLQDYILFHPEKMEKNRQYNFNQPHKEIIVPYNDSASISVIQFTAGATPRGVVLYFHGNRKNIGWYAKYAPLFTQHQYEVWMIDYPGYGKSTGTFSEDRLYKYADQLYRMASARFPADSIIIYGKSMGTGIAAWVASHRNCKELILETPYYSMTSLCAHYFPIYPVERMIHYKLPTYEYLQNVIVPVTIFHGTDDGVIPIGNAEKLIPYLKKGDAFIRVKDGSHNDLSQFPVFQQRLDALLK